MSIEKRIKALAKQSGRTVEELTGMYEAAKARFPGLPERAVYNALLVQLRKRRTFGEHYVSTFKGFVIGNLGVRDRLEEIRRKAERVFENEGLEAAVEQGLMNPDGEVLDIRETLFGRPNPNYGKPLDPSAHEYSQRLYLIVQEANSDRWEIAHMQISDPGLVKKVSNIPFYEWFSFPAIVASHDASGYQLRSTSNVSLMSKVDGKPVYFRRVQGEDTWKIYDSVMRPKVTAISDVEKYHEVTKMAWDRWIVLYGVVSSISPERETAFGVPGTLMDPEGIDEEHQVRFFYPTDRLPKITWGKLSEIYLFGRTRRSKWRDPSTGELEDADVVVDAYGVYPNPECTVKELPEAEEEIEGFL